MLTLLMLAMFLFQQIPSTTTTQTLTTPPQQQQPDPIQPQDVTAELQQRGIEIEFTGNEVFSQQELLGMLSHDCSEHTLKYLTEDIKDAEKIDVGVHLFRSCLAAKGYLRAKIGEPTSNQIEQGYKITIPVHEGARYRIGQIKIEGARVFTSEQIRSMIGLKEGEIVDAETIYEGFAVILRRAYEDRGYIQYQADPEPKFHHVPPGEREGVVDYDITIDEGQSFTIQSIEFKGNDTIPDWALRSALRLHKGKTFSRALLIESLKNLDELGLFEKIDLERDVDYAFSEKRSLVSLKISLKEKYQRL